MKRRVVGPVARRGQGPGQAPTVAGSGGVDLSLHFEGLANPTRLKIVERLAGAVEIRVSELAELCKVSQPRMSWHLRILRRARVVRTRREGREVLCRLDREAIADHLRSFVRLLAQGGPEPVDVQQFVSEVAK